MLEVQKETYLNIILSNTYSDDSFAAKSITLDFLFGFKNSDTAIISLNECLNEDNHLAKMGLNCIYGILLAVKEYGTFYKPTTVYEFVRTLINILTYKIEDVLIDNYKDCMEKILEYISENVDFKLIVPFFELANIFSFCEGSDEKRDEVLNKYCKALDYACKKLMRKDSKLLSYNLLSVKEELKEKDKDKNSFLNHINTILSYIYDGDRKELLIISNMENGVANMVNNLKKNHQQKDIRIIDTEELGKIQQTNNSKVLFLIDFEESNFDEFIYWFGMMEGKLERNQLLGCFYNCEKVSKRMLYKTLIDRYTNENSMTDKLTKFLQ